MASVPMSEVFDMGRVISRAAGAVRRNLLLFGALALILQLLPALLIRFIVPAPVIVPGLIPNFGPMYFVSLLISLTLFYVLQAAVTHATVVDLKDDKPTLAGALSRGFRLVLPLFGLAVVSGLGVALGFFLLFIPGIIVALMWVVAAPAMVEEGTGIIASLGRSRALTKGSRWGIFLLLLAIFVAFMLFTFATSFLVGSVSSVSGPGFAAATSSINANGPAMIVLTALNTLFVVLITALVAAIYVELRFVREGRRPEDLAAVFA